MCGIAGALGFRGSSVDPGIVAEMIGALRHRGPDEHNVWCGGEIALGHARLSILDLSGGKQPMSTADGRIWITFNGEIFNYVELSEILRRKGHRFRTQSDTEVILAAYREYGEECVQHFNGQWAFALWDADGRKLFLSRDRLGVRPLFYRSTPDRFEFASEIKAFQPSCEGGFQLDLRALAQIFTFWVTIPPRTAFEGVFQLPPGHSLILRDGRVCLRRYWALEYGADHLNKDEAQLAEEFLALLADAVRIRLRSDVPVGAYLSGGIDSTVIAALISQVSSRRLKTFSVGFEDAEFDESGYQQAASRFLHTEHADLRSANGDIAGAFVDVIRHTEQPILRTAPAPLYLLSRKVRESGFKVVLTGEGADEALGGYDIFKEAKIRRFWARRPGSAWRPLLLKRLYPYMEDLQRQSPVYLKSFFAIKPHLQSAFFSHLPRWEMTARLKMLFTEDVRSQIGSYDPMAELGADLPEGFDSWDEFNRAEYLEAAYLLPGYILSSQGDRVAMAHSVEGRYPFLDHRVIEFTTKLSPAAKMKVLDEKHLLKLASAGIIPEEIRTRRKQPYRAPQAKSFLGAGAPGWVEELLSPQGLKRNGIFKSDAVRALIAKFFSGRLTGEKDNMALVGVLSTQLLIQEFIHNSRTRCSSCTPALNNAYANLL